MKQVVNGIQYVVTGIGGFLGWWVGGVDGFLYALIAFIVIDYLTGVMTAVLERRLSSAIGFRGIFKKVCIFILVGVAHILDTQVMKAGSVLRTAIIFFYLSNEGISILENSVKIGLPVSKRLRDVLMQLQEDKKDE